MSEKKAYYQNPDPFRGLHTEEQAPYNQPDDDKCDCCGIELVEAPTKYGDFQFCQKCYAKISEIVFTKFWHAIVKTFGMKKAFELAMYIGDNHEPKKRQEYLPEMQPLIDTCLVAHRQIPYYNKIMEKYDYAKEIYIDFSMDFYKFPML